MAWHRAWRRLPSRWGKRLRCYERLALRGPGQETRHKRTGRHASLLAVAFGYMMACRTAQHRRGISCLSNSSDRWET